MRKKLSILTRGVIDGSNGRSSVAALQVWLQAPRMPQASDIVEDAGSHWRVGLSGGVDTSITRDTHTSGGGEQGIIVITCAQSVSLSINRAVYRLF